MLQLPETRGRPVSPRSPGATRRSRFGTLETPEREVYLLLQHVSGVLIQELATLLKPAGITPEQYHALRILRDAGPAGIPLSVVAERAVANDPDVTRLLDRLEHQGWATRNRDADDRRVVMARITSVGSRLLGRLDAAVAELHERQLGKLGSRHLPALRQLLEALVAGTGK
jgi:DNA-binding MarR family transcriptional regulator